LCNVKLKPGEGSAKKRSWAAGCRREGENIREGSLVTVAHGERG